jgi:hypothetical protein
MALNHCYQPFNIRIFLQTTVSQTTVEIPQEI